MTHRNLVAALLVSALTACDETTPHAIDAFNAPLGFKLKDATFSEITASIGAAIEFRLPKSHNEYGVCYRAGADGEIVVFMTGDEFGGPEKLLLGVAIHEHNTLDYPCAGSALVVDDLMIGSIKLGANFEKMDRLIASTEVRTAANISTFFIEQRRDLTPEEIERFSDRFAAHEIPSGVDTVLGIWGIFENERARVIGVWMEETY